MPETRLYWLHALSPTHAGVGRGVGYIDQPIDRDGVTGWPVVRGSAFKGVWRDWAVRRNLPGIDTAFGQASDPERNANSGALIPTDAQLVCLPIRSFRGTFAWCTSSLCLRMLRRTLVLAGMRDMPAVLPDMGENEANHASGTVLTEEGRIFLEDLDFTAQESSPATAWAECIAGRGFREDANWQTPFKKRFVVLSDTVFDFLCQTGTEVQTRVRIDDDLHVVAQGALWTEESLPSETILAGFVQCDRVFGRKGEELPLAASLLDRFAPDKPLMLQIGGKATVGRGQMRCVFTPVNGGQR